MGTQNQNLDQVEKMLHSLEQNSKSTLGAIDDEENGSHGGWDALAQTWKQQTQLCSNETS